jgi:hypothetical protein
MASKFETFVKAAALSLILGAGGAAAAATDSGNYGSSPPEDCSVYLKPDINNPQAYEDCKNRNQQRVENDKTRATSSQNGCDQAINNWDKTKADLGTACSAIDAKQPSSDEGAIACTPDLVKCDCGAGGVKNEQICGGSESSDDDSGSRSSSATARARAAKAKFDKCPFLAGADLDAFEKRVKDQKERTDKLKKEISDLEDKANKSYNNTNEKLTQIKEEASRAQEEHAQKLKEASRNRDAAEQKIVQEIANMQTQISQAEDALSQEEVAMKTADIRLKATKSQIRMNCHASAMAQVSKMQDQVMQKIATNTYNRGGQNEMMKNIGLTDRKQWQRIAQKYYNWCMASQPTLEAIDGANDAYGVAVLQSNKSKNSIRNKIQQMKDAQLRLRDDRACAPTQTFQANGSTGGETALCSAVRQAMEDMNQQEATYRAKVAQLNDKYNTTAQQGNREYQSFARQAQEKQSDLQAEQQRLSELEQMYALKNQKSGGLSADQKEINKARAAYNTLKGNAGTLLSCPMCWDDSGKLKGGPCQLADKFLHFVDNDHKAIPVYTPTTKKQPEVALGPPPAPTRDYASVDSAKQNTSDIDATLTDQKSKGASAK